MRSLQALWIETGPTAKYDIIPLLKVLPRSLRVLAFYVQYDAYIELLQLLSGLPCLASVCLPHNIPLTAELLAMDIPNLTFVATGTRAVKLKRDFPWAPAELCPMTTLELGTLHASDLDDPDLAWMTDMLRAWLTSPVWNAIH
ncbi:hypothetical protein ID866_3679 [Astraeus odoratus]|nr:hypothetical protein ID866_3679 [Astraeus odoratus]